MSKTIQERFEKGEKVSKKEMIEVVRWRTIYKITIQGIVRDVGETYRALNYEDLEKGKYKCPRPHQRF